MKRLFIIAAISGVALTGCTKNEVVPSASEQQEITFANPVSHVVTKVDLVPTTYPTSSSFSVFADYHKDAYATAKGATSNFTAYMRGTEGVDVTHSTVVIETAPAVYNSYWTSSNPYYWPKDGYLTFAAYSPADTKNDLIGTGPENIQINYDITNGVKITGYEVKTDLSNQRDLMLSNRVVDQESTDMVYDDPSITPTAYDGVQLTFNHVLSAIKFSVAADADYSTDGYTITLDKLSIKNAYTKGNLTQFADINAETIGNVWGTTQNTPGDYTIATNAGNLTPTAKTFSDETHADLVLLPQDLTRLVAPKKVVAEIIYTIKRVGLDATSIQYTKEFVLDQTIDGSGTWDASKRYIYTITIGMDKVIFAPSVGPWVD